MAFAIQEQRLLGREDRLGAPEIPRRRVFDPPGFDLQFLPGRGGEDRPDRHGLGAVCQGVCRRTSKSGSTSKKIDYVIANHAEIDHSGALPELMEPHPRYADLLHGQRRQVAQGPLPQGLELPSREDRGQPEPGEEGADLRRGADAPLAGQHVLLPDRGQHPLQQRRLRPALRLGVACSTTWSTRRS